MRIAAFLALTALLVPAIPAVGDQLPHVMHSYIVEDLSPEAMEHYVEAQMAHDRANRDETARALFRAAKAQPENVDLQFFALDRLVDRAEVTYGETSSAYYSDANELLAGLGKHQRLQPAEKDRLNAYYQRLNGRPAVGELPARAGMANEVDARDQKRLNSGLKLMLNVAAARLEERGIDLSSGKKSADGTGTAGTGLADAAAGGTKGKVNPFAPLPGEQLKTGIAAMVETGVAKIESNPPQNPFAGGGAPGNPFAGGGGAAPPPANPFAAGAGAPPPVNPFTAEQGS